MTTRLMLLYGSATLVGALGLISIGLASGPAAHAGPGIHAEVISFSARVNGEVVDYEILAESPANETEIKREFLDDVGGTEVQAFVTSNSTPKSPTTFYYNPAGRPAAEGLANPAAALQAAGKTWTDADSPWAYVYGGETAAAPGLCRGQPMDGLHTVGWYTPPDPNTSVLAVTCSVTAVATREKLEWDIEFYARPTWTDNLTSVSRDFESVALHELGHGVGLGHSTNTQAVMYGAYFIGSVKRELHADDVAGLQFLHGAGPGATVAATNTATTAAASTATPTATATKTPTSTPTTTPTLTPTPVSTVSSAGPPPQTCRVHWRKACLMRW
jgi:hypothetical protein